MTRSDADGAPAAVLATARAGGTLAAVRSLGAKGIPVTVLASQFLAAARWSRFTASAQAMPAENDPRFLERLCALGAARPGQVLLPTSDQTAWLYAREQDTLCSHFRTYLPPLEVIETVLDKARLADLGRRAGVPVIDTWAPGSPAEAAKLAPQLTYPVLIKARSHIERQGNHKGLLVHDAEGFVQAYARMVSLENAAQRQAGLPDVPPPVVQRFVPMGREGVCSVSGFIDRTGTLFVSRVSAKVFLRMQPAGVGVCYEARPPSAELSEAARKLCLAAGFFGAFEIEFVRWGAGWAPIDFNPRLFSQVGLDVARGMPLPHLLWLAALDRRDELAQAVEAARAAESDPAAHALYDRFTLGTMLTAMAVTKRATKAERAYWHDWRRTHAPMAVDYAWDRRDLLPGLVHAASEILLGLRALPRFLRAAMPAAPEANVGAKAA
jgi:predicted ATP-grasp superfamily ATP-dependent carboligase